MGDVRNLFDLWKIVVLKGKKDLKYDRRMFKDYNFVFFKNLIFCIKFEFFLYKIINKILLDLNWKLEMLERVYNRII